jgi:monoamine oxidase
VTAIARLGKGFELSFGAKSEAFDAVVLALPFTKLRDVAGIEALGLNPLKLRAIRELGYGNHMRLVCGAASRVWLTPAAGLPYRSNGAFYADLPFQSVLDSSRAQPGERGLISNFMAGKALPADTASAFNALRAGLSAISPAIGDALDRDSAASFAWGSNPWSFGSYASAKPGQYTSLLPVAGALECDGRLHFAGEHTEPIFLGYMNGAVLSGNRTARSILTQTGP